MFTTLLDRQIAVVTFFGVRKVGSEGAPSSRGQATILVWMVKEGDVFHGPHCFPATGVY